MLRYIPYKHVGIAQQIFQHAAAKQKREHGISSSFLLFCWWWFAKAPESLEPNANE